MLKLNTPIKKLHSIGPVSARRLARLGITTLEDLLYHLPHRYEDYSLVSKIAKVQVGETVTIQGKIIEIKNEYRKGGRPIQKATIEDETGKLDMVWFNQPYLTRILGAGEQVSLSGKVELFGNKFTMQSPSYEKLKIEKSPTIHTGRLVPVYPETASISSKWLRNKIAIVLPNIDIEEFLPPKIAEKFDLLDLKQSFEYIHFPTTMEEAKRARLRFAFEELFLIQTTVLERKKHWQSRQVCHQIAVKQQQLSDFLASLPYQLTKAQQRTIGELIADLVRQTPMNRLLEGDVGSGKTVVAAIGAFLVAKNGWQTVMMAPTQILARQHYQTLSTLLKPYGMTVQLVTSDLKSKLLNPKSRIDVVVGTHALLHRKNLFQKLALVVIDEQHKFGVEQRAALLKQVTGSSCLPHTLTMTATPIPRTIVLTVYGDLDLSVLDQLPPGRQKVTTWLVPNQKRSGAYQWITKQIQQGQQAFIVCPLIEQSAIESMQQVKAATAEFKRLQREVFPALRLGLLHGRMKPKEKEQAISQFRNKKVDILVSTPVVEVGIDIANATIMVVEAAERFGLAQLHQLRGRVGRGEQKSYCLLFTESISDNTRSRLTAMQQAKSGPELAELDLRLRGAGELFGTKQHGFPELRVASFSDFALIKKTRQAAGEIFPRISQYPRLVSKLHAQLVAPN